MLAFLLRAAVLAIAVFGTVELLVGRDRRAPGGALALFLAIAAFDSLVTLDALWRQAPQPGWICGLQLLLTILYGPAIYLYILTATGRMPSPRRIAAYVGGTLAIGLVLLSMFLTLPPQTWVDLQRGTPIADPHRALMAGVVAWVLRISYLIVTVGFLVLSWRALDENLRRLRAIYSSIEDRSLTWLRGVMIVVLLASGWVALEGLLGQVTQLGVWLGAVDAGITLTVVGLLAHFGVRQLPVPPDAEMPALPAPEAAGKYARSALDSHRMQKLADRMETLMRSQALHRDPNLSLRGLSDAVGASPNYISQTLNDHLGVSFFDFVNRFRVEDAERLLRDTESPVLDVALEVGFNSRSTFNAALRKHRGASPTEIRLRA
jgi:AraC-like DNA-binding protein